jgi:hypothetical protein
MDEFQAAIMGPDNAFIRMTYGYWEMAASFVVNGAIDAKMFDDANAEHINLFSKVEPFVGQFRAMLNSPGFLKNLEKVCYEMPGPPERVIAARERARALAAAAAAKKAE